MFFRRVVTVIAQLALTAASAALPDAEKRSACRSIPGDRGWPPTATWDRLNETVGERLIATDPLAHVCHDPTYSNATCTSLKEEWGIPGLQ